MRPPLRPRPGPAPTPTKPTGGRDALKVLAMMCWGWAPRRGSNLQPAERNDQQRDRQHCLSLLRVGEFRRVGRVWEGLGHTSRRVLVQTMIPAGSACFAGAVTLRRRGLVTGPARALVPGPTGPRSIGEVVMRPVRTITEVLLDPITIPITGWADSPPA